MAAETIGRLDVYVPWGDGPPNWKKAHFFNREGSNDMTTNIAADELRLLIERIENLETDKKAVSDDIREVYSEAKSRGFDPKIMRQIVKLRSMETHERQEWEAVLDTYIAALGM
jgi:uncharacterized protein (UPF0335 family)